MRGQQAFGLVGKIFVRKEHPREIGGVQHKAITRLALILLVIELLVSLLAKAIAGRFDVQRTLIA